MTDNWYLVLDLEFDPNPVTDEKVIRERIEEKKKFWSQQAIKNPLKGKEYSALVDQIPQITKDMLDPATRADLIKDACEKKYGPIDRTLKTLKMAEVSEDVLEKIAKRSKVDLETVKQRARSLGLKIGASQDGKYQKLYDRYCKDKVQGEDKYKTCDPMLKVFHVSNLYEFLFEGTGIKSPQNLPCDKLVQRAKERKTKEFNKHDQKSGDGSKLCKFCEDTFKDDNSKLNYDKYLEITEIRKILSEVKSISDIKGDLSKENVVDYVGKLTQIMKNSKDAEALLIAYCKVEKILIPVADSSDEDRKTKMKLCRCGHLNDVSDGRKVCGNCGLELQIKCPKCGTLSDNTTSVCKCGFEFKKIDKAIALCELADLALETMDFDVAEAHLKDAEAFWPGSQKVKEVKDRLDNLKCRVGNAAGEMKKACADKRYFEARKHLESVKKFAPNYSEPLLEEEINNAIKEAERYKKEAQSSMDEAHIVDACTKAYEACHDCPGIKEIISRYPPAAPSNLQIATDTVLKKNVLSWTPSATKGLLFYSVMRKEGAVPISIQDGTLVGRVSMCSIEDSGIKPGIQYYYSVFAERASVYSTPLSCKDPVCNLFEISNVKIAAGESQVHLTWDSIAGNASVEIEQINPAGKKTKLDCNSRTDFVDNGLENDKEYRYRIYLTYTIGVKKLSTDGVNLSATPTSPPLPIDRLVVRPLDGNEFQIEWDNPNGGDVRFFYSNKKPEWLFGDLVSVSELESSMNNLIVSKTQNGQGKFKHDGEELIYVLAVSEKSGSAVIGSIARASRGGSVKIKSVSLINGKIMISLVELPKDCTGFVVLYCHDQYPNDISDTNTKRKYYPLKQYQYDGGILVDSNEPENYYFSVFAEFKRDGESDYSTATDYLFNNVGKLNITYSIHVNKKLFSADTVEITFEGETKAFDLPDTVIISKHERAPMFKNAGEILYEIPGTKVNEKLKIDIPLKGIPRDTYIKPFVKDDSLSESCIFKQKLGSNNKIT